MKSHWAVSAIVLVLVCVRYTVLQVLVYGRLD